MRMFVAHRGPLGAIQHEVMVLEIIVHEGIYLALHRPAKVDADNQYSMWIVSDYITGFAITRSISKKYAIEKAKKIISQNKYKMVDAHARNLKRLTSTPNASVDFVLFERIRRKGEKRGIKTIEVINYR